MRWYYPETGPPILMQVDRATLMVTYPGIPPIHADKLPGRFGAWVHTAAPKPPPKAVTAFTRHIRQALHKTHLESTKPAPPTEYEIRMGDPIWMAK